MTAKGFLRRLELESEDARRELGDVTDLQVAGAMWFGTRSNLSVSSFPARRPPPGGRIGWTHETSK